MDRKDFYKEVATKLNREFINIYPDGFPVKKAEVVTDLVLDSIFSVLLDGDEVRLPVGVFYPKLIHRENQIVSARMEFESFAPTNTKMVQRFLKYPIYMSRGSESKVRIVSAGGHFSIFAKDGAELFTLSEIAHMAGISLITAYKYAKKYSSLLERTENGTNKQYPESVVALFKSIRQKNSPVIPEQRQKPQQEREDLTGKYSLLDVSRLAGVSTITLRKYMKQYAELAPVAGRSHSKRFDDIFLQRVIEIRDNNLKVWGRRD